MGYCSHNMLNMFRATLCPSSGARDYYVSYYGLWCAMPWLLVVGGQVQGSRLYVRDEGLCFSKIPHPGRIACCPAPDLRQPAIKAQHPIGGNNTHII